MSDELIQKTFDEVSSITRSFDAARRKLIDYQMQVMAGMNNISLMPDVITLAIDAVDSSPDTTSLGSELAGFVYGLVFMAKARYETVVEKNKKAASELLRSTAKILIDNVGNLLSIAQQGIGNVISTLRNLFLNNDNWIKKLIEFFDRKAQLKEVRETYTKFVETVLAKISRQPALMNKSKLYSEIAHDHDSLLMQRKIAALKKEYPNPNTFVRAYVLLIGLMPLLLIPLMYSLSGGASDMMYIALCIFVVYALLFWQMISIIRSWKQRKVAKESEIERYKG